MSWQNFKYLGTFCRTFAIKKWKFNTTLTADPLRIRFCGLWQSCCSPEGRGCPKDFWCPGSDGQGKSFWQTNLGIWHRHSNAAVLHTIRDSLWEKTAAHDFSTVCSVCPVLKRFLFKLVIMVSELNHEGKWCTVLFVHVLHDLAAVFNLLRAIFIKTWTVIPLKTQISSTFIAADMFQHRFWELVWYTGSKGIKTVENSWTVLSLFSVYLNMF